MTSRHENELRSEVRCWLLRCLLLICLTRFCENTSIRNSKKRSCIYLLQLCKSFSTIKLQPDFSRQFLLFKNEGSSFLLNKKGLLENYFFFQFYKTLMAWHYIVSIFSRVSWNNKLNQECH